MTDETKHQGQLDRTQDAFRAPLSANEEGPSQSAFIELPRHIGRYSVVSVLGRGAMGSVHLAFDTELGRHVALKVLSASTASHAEARQRFSREAQAAAALNHPGICAIHSIERVDEILFLVLEYVRGKSFRQLLDDPTSGWPPKPRVAAGYILQVADALRAAHASGIVHRDVKCSNLMRTTEDGIKILDFGLAKVDGLNLLTQDGSIVGTPAYISPEQAQGDPVDARSDLWSLGVVFYEVLTGRLPFPENTIASLTYAVLHNEPPPVRQIRPDVPAPFSWVIQKLLTKQRDQRYPSAAALMAELAPLAEPGMGDGSSRSFVAAGSAVSNSRAGMDSLLGTSERRAVTFLYIELAASTSHQDPEDFENSLEHSRGICARVISQHQGYLQQWIGNSASVYFGYPSAHEGAARLAVSAGIALAEAFSRNDAGFAFRGGIETTLVVADTTQPKPLSGEGFELARALCGLAESNQLFVGAAARRQVEHLFEFAPEDDMLLPRGRKLRYAQALHASTARSRLLRTQSTQIPLIGRDQEMRLLIRNWEGAVEGYGNVVLLGGASGLGKSRLTYELKRQVAQNSSAALIECFCAPQYAHTALYPVIECFDRIVFESDTKAMSQEEKLGALEGTLAQLGFPLPETLPLFASLLGVYLPDSAKLEITPERFRVLTLEALVTLLVERASRQPLLFVVEDLHWADPTTLELLRMLVDHLAAVPLLALYTHRPEFISSLPQRSHVSIISLSRLSRSDSLQMVSAASRAATLDSATREQIIGNSDGVPLFLEEMTKTAIETGERADKSMRLPVPATLRDSFVARLDQLGPARNVARVAAVLGREFPELLLEAVSELPADELRQNVDRLIEAEILYVRGSGGRRTLIFKHALLQEAAYDSLLRNSRLTLHARAADLLMQQFPVLAARQPEIIANHFTQGGLGAKAIPYWHQAGIAALQRSAYVEAISQLERGLAVYRALEPNRRDSSQELMLLTSLGPALIATLGFGAERVGDTFRQAEQLVQANGDPMLTLSALWGVWVYSLVRSELGHALVTARQMIAIGEQLADDAMRLEGHWTAGNTLYWRGELESAHAHLKTAEALYDGSRFKEHAYRFGQDPLVGALCYQSFVCCFLGLFDEAKEISQRCIDHARSLHHPFSIGWSLTFRATLECFLGNYSESNEWAEQAVRYCQEQAYPFWISAALSASGRSLAGLGDLEQGKARLREGIEMTRLIGSRVIEPLFRGQLAEALLLHGDDAEALIEIEAAIRQSDEQGVQVSALELRRIHGVALMKAGRADEAEAVLRECLNACLASSCRLVALRVASDLGTLFEDRESIQRVLEEFPVKSNEPPVLRSTREVLRRI